MENIYPTLRDNRFAFAQHGPTDEEIRLRALNHTKDKLMSIIGHDLRTAIGGVLTLSMMVEKKLQAGDIEEAKRLNGLIKRSSLDAEEVLRDMLNWARSSQQEIHFKLETIDVLEFIRMEIARIQPAATEKGIAIAIIESDSGIIRADRYMLSSTLRNLLSNALKFSHANERIDVRVTHQPGQWLFRIQDYGIGMHPEIQERLLKIDDRKQQTGTCGEKGSGFGLLLCDDFIQRHGGQLYWKSAPDEGSAFFFTIPELLG